MLKSETDEPSGARNPFGVKGRIILRVDDVTVEGSSRGEVLP